MPVGVGYTVQVPVREIDAQDVKDAFCHFFNYPEKVDLGFGVLENNPVTKEQFVASCCTQFMLSIYKNYMIEKVEADAKALAEQQAASRAIETAAWFDNLRLESLETNPYTNHPVAVGGGLYETNKNTQIDITLSATDPDNLPLTFEIVQNENYQCSVSYNIVSIIPNTDYIGSTNIGFKCFNGTKYSPVVYHELTVNDVV